MIKIYVLSTSSNAVNVKTAISNDPMGYVVGGDALNLEAMMNPNFLPGVHLKRAPVMVGVLSEEMHGYHARVIHGATPQTYKIKFYTPEGPEIPAGDYPEAIINGSLYLVIVP